MLNTSNILIDLIIRNILYEKIKNWPDLICSSVHGKLLFSKVTCRFSPTCEPAGPGWDDVWVLVCLPTLQWSDDLLGTFHFLPSDHSGPACSSIVPFLSFVLHHFKVNFKCGFRLRLGDFYTFWRSLLLASLVWSFYEVFYMPARSSGENEVVLSGC